MASILKLPLNLALRSSFQHASRNFTASPSLRLKQSMCGDTVIEEQKGKDLVIRAQITPSERVPYLVKPGTDRCCAVCASGLDIKHTDVLIVSQFVRSDGCMLPRRVTGLCKRQQKRVMHLVAMAQKAGLMPNLAPSYSKRDPKARYGWKKFNKYFDESTIQIR